MAVELRQGPGRPKEAHLVPWGQVFQSYEAGKPGITLQEIVVNPPLERRAGAYEISRLDLVRLSGYFDLAAAGDCDFTLEEEDYY